MVIVIFAAHISVFCCGRPCFCSPDPHYRRFCCSCYRFLHCSSRCWFFFLVVADIVVVFVVVIVDIIVVVVVVVVVVVEISAFVDASGSSPHHFSCRRGRRHNRYHHCPCSIISKNTIVL